MEPQNQQPNNQPTQPPTPQSPVSDQFNAPPAPVQPVSYPSQEGFSQPSITPAKASNKRSLVFLVLFVVLLVVFLVLPLPGVKVSSFESGHQSVSANVDGNIFSCDGTTKQLPPVVTQSKKKGLPFTYSSSTSYQLQSSCDGIAKPTGDSSSSFFNAIPLAINTLVALVLAFGISKIVVKK